MTFVVPNLERVTDSDLKLAFDDLKRRHIALAIGTGMIVRSDRCRSNTEAYVNPGSLEFVFEKVRRDEGDVKYVGSAAHGGAGGMSVLNRRQFCRWQNLWLKR
jgi:hypothetical protein